MDKPWPWWVVLPAFIVLVVVMFGAWALPFIWAPLAIVPLALWGLALWGSFRGNLRGRK